MIYISYKKMLITTLLDLSKIFKTQKVSIILYWFSVNWNFPCFELVLNDNPNRRIKCVRTERAIGSGESNHLKEASAGEDTYFRYLRTIRTPSDSFLSLAEAIF